MRRSEQRVAVDLARVLVACKSYAGSDDASLAWWAVWLDQVRAAGFSLDSLDAAVSARAQRLALSLWGSRSLVDALDTLLASHEVADTEHEQLFGVATLAGRREHQLGVWAAQLPDGVEGGWGLRGDFDLSLARAVVGDSPFDTLARLCEQFNLERVSELSRAVARDAASWDITLPVGYTPLEVLWDELAHELSLPAAPPALHRWLSRPAATHAGIEPALSVRFVGDAPVALRLVVPTSDHIELAAALVGAGIAPAADTALAAVSGSLGVAPRAATLVRDRDGYDLELVV